MSSQQVITDSQELLDASRQAETNEQEQWAATAFPGITNISRRPVQRGGEGANSAVIGTWHGMALAFSTNYLGEHTAHACALCSCCKMWAYTWPSPALSSAADIARKYDAAPGAAVSACYHCRWLHPAQARARLASTWYQRLGFRYEFADTPEAVLAMDCHDREHAAA